MDKYGMIAFIWFFILWVVSMVLFVVGLLVSLITNRKEKEDDLAQ